MKNVDQMADRLYLFYKSDCEVRAVSSALYTLFLVQLQHMNINALRAFAVVMLTIRNKGGRLGRGFKFEKVLA